jgi:hypothetical protein
MYTKSMDISFDSQKDLKNQAERGISLSEAANLNWDSWLGAEDVRRDLRGQIPKRIPKPSGADTEQLPTTKTKDRLADQCG